METLRDLRLAQGLTQAELAERAGLRVATLSAIERRQSWPRHTTIEALAQALATTPASIAKTLQQEQRSAAPAADWRFLDGLDTDLRHGLLEQLLALWTHHSTALEGNTISLGDTLFILREGATVSGHSLREHAEIHGHRQAIALLDRFLDASRGPTVAELHELHRQIQTGVTIDIFAPVGRWKVEANGTQAITSDGMIGWHDYASPAHTPALMRQVLRAIDRHCKKPPSDPAALVDAFVDIHLSITNVHPYADGNGRLARLLANLPVLRAGQPPILIQQADRKRYLQLLGDYCLARGAPVPGEMLVGAVTGALTALRDFIHEQWSPTLQVVADAHRRQAERTTT